MRDLIPAEDQEFIEAVSSPPPKRRKIGRESSANKTSSPRKSEKSDVPNEYVYLPAPTTPAYHLRLTIEGTSSICREGSLWVNIPAEGEEFDRSKFRQYKLEPDFNKTIHVDIPITQAGAFAFYTASVFIRSDTQGKQGIRTGLGAGSKSLLASISKLEASESMVAR